MKIKVVSDLHLEFADINIKNSTENDIDVLVLSGDILVADKLLKPNSETGGNFRDFLKRVSFQFPHVIYVAGNHEFYGGGKFFQTVEDLRTYCSTQFNNVYYLERDCKQIDDVLFVGGTLWTDMNKYDPLTLHAIRDTMYDYRAIKNDRKGYVPLKPADTVERHRETLGYIKHIVGENVDKKIVVVGHHAPSFQSCHEMYRHDYIGNGAYYSELGDYIADHPQIKVWTHGHTHWPYDYLIGETRIICNPRGYEGYENTGWDPDMVIEV